MNNDLFILLQSKIDEKSSLSRIQGQLKALQSKLSDINIKLNLGDIDKQTKDMFSSMTKQALTETESTNRAFERLSNNIRRYKENMGSKIDMMEMGKVVDPAEIERMRNVLNGLSASTKGVTETMKDLTTSYTITNRESQTKEKALTVESNAYKKLTSDIEIFKKVQGERLGSLSKNTNADTKEIERLNSAINSLSVDTPNAGIKMKELRTDVSLLGKASESTGQSFGLLTRYFSAHAVFSITRQAVKSMYEEVKLLDSALVELQKVSDLSGKSLESFTRAAFSSAEEVGKTGREMISATTVFKRAGYELSESFELGKAGLMLTNIAEGIKDVEVASTSLVSILKGFRKEASDVNEVLDSLNEVSNTQAINFDDLAEGMSRISGVMNQQGNTLAESMGLLVGGQTTIQNIEKVSSGILTITQRLAGMDEETGEMGSPEVISKLNDEFERLAGISLIDSQGQIRDTYGILEDMARVFPTLNKNTRQYLSELSAGKRQSNVLQAILDGWSEVSAANESAINSMGSAAKENEIYLDSIEGKVNNLKSAFQSLSATTIDSGFVKTIIDATTFMIKLTEATGGLIPVLLSLGSALMILKFKDLTFSILGMIPALNGAAVGFAGLNTAMSIGVLGAVIAGIMAIGASINHMSKSAERAQQKVQTLKQELSDLQADQSTVATLGEQYDALAQLKKEQGLNNEEQREFTRIQNELKELLPTINGYYNDQGDFLISASESMETFNKEMKEYLGYKREELANAATDVLSGNIKRYKKEAEELEKLSKYHELYNKQINEGLTDAEGDMMGDLQRDLGLPIDVIEEKLKNVTESYNDAKNSIHDNIRDIIKNTDAWGKATGEQRDAMLKFLSEVDGKKLDEFATEIRGGKEATEEFVKTLKTLPDVLNIIKDEEENVKQSTDRMAGSYESIEENIENLVGTLTELEEMQKKNTDGYSYSYKEIEELRKKYPELESAIYKTAKGWKIEQGAIDDLRGSQIELSKTHMEAQFKMQQDSLDATKTRISHITKEIEAVQNLAQARSVAAGLATKRGVSKEDQSVFGAFGGTYNYEDYKNKKVAEIQKTLSSRITKDTILGIINNQGSGSNVLTEQDYAALKKDQMDIVSYGKDIEALEKLKIDVAKKYDEVTSGGLTGGVPDKGKKAKTDKSQLPKYLTQGYDDILKEILAKSDKLEREIEQANAKILNAQLLGNTEEELALQTQLENMYNQRIELEKEKSIALIGLRKKVSSELAKQNFDVLKGVNLESITEKQLADINRKLDAQIDKASKAKNDKLANSYKIQQDMINEHVKFMLDADSNINSISLNVRELENESIERSIALIERKYELEDKLINDRIRSRDVEMLLTKDGSEEQLRLQKENYDDKLEIQNNYLKRIKELREQEIEVDAEVIEKYKDAWYQAETERINMLKTMGERAKKLKLDSLNLEQEELNNAQKATQTLVDMVIKMLKQQYAEEKALIQENSKVKEDAIKKELDGYKKIIDAKKKSLREDKDNKDYDKELKVKQKKVSDVENKILTLANDNSKKAQAERLKLEEEKLGLIDELNEFQENRSIDLQEKALDEELKRYEDAKNEELNQYKTQKDKELKILDDHLSKEGNLRAEAIRLIENKNKNLYNQLIEWNREYSTGVDSDISDAWDSAYNAMETYNNGQLDVLQTLGNIVEKLKEVKVNIEDVNNSSWQDYTDQADISPDKSKFPVYETEPDKKPSGGSVNNSSNKYTEAEAKKIMQQNEQKYLHSEMVKAINSKNEGQIKALKAERKKWGLDPDNGTIWQEGKVPDEYWKKHKARYGFLKGGETSRTGFHWLDGSQKLPERILSPEQTQSFNKLVEYLPNVVSKLENFDKVDNSKREILLQIDNMINVEGDLDERVDIVALMRDATDEMMAKINKALNVRYGW